MRAGSRDANSKRVFLVEAGSFYDEGRGGMISKKNVKRVSFVRSAFADTQITTVGTGPGKVPSRPVVGAESYDQGAAPCVCCEGESQNQGTHKLMHQAQAGALTVPRVPLTQIRCFRWSRRRESPPRCKR